MKTFFVKWRSLLMNIGKAHTHKGEDLYENDSFNDGTGIAEIFG